jgi:hypothetical protein
MRGNAAVIFITAFIALATLGDVPISTADAAHSGGMDAMSIDLDPYGTPANARAAEFGAECADNLDNDADTRVNDGCPTTPATVGTPETGIACNDPLIAIDNDLDGTANDGCSETSCLDSLDNDADSAVNDGCPTFGGPTIGSREPCARINENDLRDADEDIGADTLSLDVTAANIPAASPMIAFAFTLEYPADMLTVESHDPGYLIASYPKSRMFDVSDPAPDDNGDNTWNAAVADTNDNVGEVGSGVLSRLSLSSEQGVAPGLHPVTLTSAAHIDPNNDSHIPDVINNALVATDQPCP